jgi:mRNA interferase MazF
VDQVHRGDIWWADIPEPRGSAPGYRRPVVVMQADVFNRSGIRTVIVAAVTGNLDLTEAPGTVFLPAQESGLARDSVVNVSQILTLDREDLTEFAGHLPGRLIRALNQGLRLVQEL